MSDGLSRLDDFKNLMDVRDQRLLREVEKIVAKIGRQHEGGKGSGNSHADGDGDGDGDGETNNLKYKDDDKGTQRGQGLDAEVEKIKNELQFLSHQQEATKRELEEKDRSINDLSSEIFRLRRENESLRSPPPRTKESSALSPLQSSVASASDKNNSSSNNNNNNNNNNNSSSAQVNNVNTSSNEEFYQLAAIDNVAWAYNEDADETESNSRPLSGIFKFFGGGGEGGG